MKINLNSITTKLLYWCINSLSWFNENSTLTGIHFKYVYFITYRLILITSPSAILNSAINSFYPLDTALLLTSDNFTSIFLSPPSLLPSSCPAPTLVALLRNCHVASSLLCVHIRLVSSDWERHLWLSKRFGYGFMCLCVPFIRRSLHFFSARHHSANERLSIVYKF